LQLIKDYDLGINYHPGKANVGANALSRRSHLNMLATRKLLPEFCKEFEKLNLGWVSNTEAITIEVDSMLEQDIQKIQLEDAKIQEIKEQIKEDKAPEFSVDVQRMLWYKKRLCVLKVKEIKELILREAHDSTYSIYPGSTKMYQDLKSRYWWYGTKRAIAEYVALCDNYQRVKVERQRPIGLLQPPVHRLPLQAPNSAATAFTASPPPCHAPAPPSSARGAKPAHLGPFSFLRMPKPLPPIWPRCHAACHRWPPSRTWMELNRSAARPPSLSRTSSAPHQLPSLIQC
jgi:hypothetical protein